MVAKNETEALAGDDNVLAEWLASSKFKKTNEHGELWDPVAGLWRTPLEYAKTYRERKRRRAILGSHEDTVALNRYERGLGY